MTFTKANLVDVVSTRVDLPKTKAALVIDSLLEVMKTTLANGEDLLVSGFGKFCVKGKKARRGRNPATGEDLMLGSRRVVTFKCSTVLREKINRGKPKK